ncbi:GAF domain-containing sensor histidine kinase [Candidatus Woesebacteria bacterium]|nr:GAF domain-containing sensor histidine kinase [Candidatus Woesebacteria bacterium]
MANYSTTPQKEEIIKALWRLQKVILDTLDFNKVVEVIVNGLLTELGYLKLGYRIIVLTLVDKKNNVLKRISLSQTSEAKKALEASAIPFHEIEIPLNSNKNLLIKTLKEKKPYVTHYWPDIFTPVLTPEQALTNQRAAGIKTSMLYPVVVRDKPIGVLIFSMVKDEKEVSSSEKDLIRGFTDVVGLAVQNARLYTELEDTTEKLKRANEKLKDLDKLKDEFVSVASHELKTPMTVIKSYLWLALSGKAGDLTDKQKDYLDKALGSTERLIRLVNDMLNVSRIESGRIVMNMQKVDLVKLGNEVLFEVKPRADELGINIENKVSKVPEVLADPDKIKEVLINFIGNSIKFTPKGGKITISYGKEDKMVFSHVTDTGSGIEKENLGKLFQKFSLIKKSYVTNKKETQGTGLGLYISKSIIELHKGKIWAESEGLGKGATFSFTLPEFNEKDLRDFQKKIKDKKDLGLIHHEI